MPASRQESAAKRSNALKEAPAEWVDPKQLSGWKENPRKNDGAVASVAASIERFGFGAPIIARRQDREVIAGHTRLKAALQLGLEAVPVRYLDLSLEEAHLLALADNKLGELADWDDEQLAKILGDYSKEDALSVGFSEEELAELLGGPLSTGVTDGDIPDPPADPVTRLGDVWTLGRHRLVCGDSRSLEVALLARADNHVHLHLTDPPYNVALGADETPEQAKRRNRRTDGLVVENDSMSNDDFRVFLVSAFRSAFAILDPGSAFYIWHAESEGFNFRAAVLDVGEQVRQCLIWVKSSLVMGRQDYQWQHEPCLYGWKAGAAHRWHSDRKQTTVLEYDKPSRNEKHPTVKPAEMFAYLIGNSTKQGEAVFDGFLGSGTTLVAAEQMGRSCYGVELSPAYCDVIVERWQNLTGGKATREAA